MWTINKLTDVNQDMVQQYSGFTSCIVYSTAHQSFRESITRNWQALNDWSGKSLLMLVADETAPVAQKPLPPEILSIQMITQIPGFSPGITDKANFEISKHFGVKRADMPCIIFFSDVNQPETLVYSFKTDDVIDSMHRIFDDCSEAWIDPTKDEAKNLTAYRKNMMLRLEPQLKKRKFLRLVSKIANNAPFGRFLAAAWS